MYQDKANYFFDRIHSNLSSTQDNFSGYHCFILENYS
jgi:hypothetical protein